MLLWIDWGLRRYNEEGQLLSFITDLDHRAALDLQDREEKKEIWCVFFFIIEKCFLNSHLLLVDSGFTLFFKGPQGPPGPPGKAVSFSHCTICLKDELRKPNPTKFKTRMKVHSDPFWYFWNKDKTFNKQIGDIYCWHQKAGWEFDARQLTRLSIKKKKCWFKQTNSHTQYGNLCSLY